MKKHFNIFISGEVQGVFFRIHAKKRAEELALTGFVQNLPDGRVYIEAEGEEGALGKLLEWCRRGPDSAEVTKVETKEGPAEHFTSFTIKP